MSFNRKRTALACTYCRHRKRRCDAAKPRCANCVEAEVDCQYDDAPSQRIDTSGGSREILSRLRDIERLLENQSRSLSSICSEVNNGLLQQTTRGSISDFASSPQSRSSIPSTTTISGVHRAGSSSNSNVGIPASPWMGLPPEPDMSHLPPLTIPPKHKTSSSYLLGMPTVKALIGEYPKDLFFLLESRNPLPDALSAEKLPSPWMTPASFDRAETDYCVRCFFETAHNNHPILDRDEFEQIYSVFAQKGPDSGVESALCMVVIAVGAAAASPIEIHDFRTAPPGMFYMQQALPTLITLSSWSFSSSILLPQALVLASIYFAYIVRPLQSWRMIYNASTLLQFRLSGLDTRLEDTGPRESILRLFWSCFLIECDRLAELELPRSGLQQLTDETSLPNCSSLDPMESTCYLAEISIRRLLNRIHNSLYPRKQHVLSLSSTSLMMPDEFSFEDIMSMGNVCDELHRQLDMWYASIPESSRPALGDGPLASDRQVILRIRYYAARHIIYRPFALYVASQGAVQVSSSILEKAAMCIESCRRYLHNVGEILKRPSQYTWTFSLSSLGAVVVLTLCSLSETVRHLVADIDELQTIALENIRPWSISSLEAVVSILEDIQRKQRLFSQI